MIEVNPVGRWREDGILRDLRQDEIDRLRRELSDARKALEQEEMKRMDWNVVIEDLEKKNAELQEALGMRDAQIDKAVAIVRRIGEGNNSHRKCLAPTKCCPSNRLCFPCLANDFLASLASIEEPAMGNPCREPERGEISK